VNAGAGYEPIHTECFLVKEGCSLEIHRFVQILVKVLVETLHVDPDLFEETDSFCAVMSGTFN